jgi:hypothetical protein
MLPQSRAHGYKCRILMALRPRFGFGLLLLAACSTRDSSAGDGASPQATTASYSNAGDGGCSCNHATEYAWYDGTNPGICLPLPSDCLGTATYGYPYGDGSMESNTTCLCDPPTPPDAGNLVGTECVETVACGLTLTALPTAAGSHSGSGNH